MPNLNLTVGQQQEVCDRYMGGESGKPLADAYGITSVTVRSIVRRHGLPTRTRSARRRQWSFDERFFETIDTADKAYMLGFLAADGNVHGNTVSIQLSEVDLHILLSFKSKINHGGNITHHAARGATKPAYTLRMPSKAMATDLLRFGITERKSETLDLNMHLIPSSLHHHVIRGLYDGNGCTHQAKTHARTATTSLVGADPTMDTLGEIIHQATGVSMQVKPYGSISKIYCCAQNAYRWLWWMYQDSDESNRLSRKYSTYLQVQAVRQAKGAA